ncbi:MAG TPA: hypothetical protein VGK34_10220 [Armatimonadota bacterium]|jgi:hypothetical protein
MHITVAHPNTETFCLALNALNQHSVSYAIGGAFAMYHYSGMWRNTNDLDIFVERADMPHSVDILSACGFQDLGEKAAGDRQWIYHAVKDDVIVDLIWGTPNHLSIIDTAVIARAERGRFVEVETSFLPADVLIWTKIFTLNHHRCDWPDIFSIVCSRPAGLDWGLLLETMGENWPVLLSFVILFDWVYPNERTAIPVGLRNDLLALSKSITPQQPGLSRESLLDPWIYSRPISP